jgi:hypothetical protein
MYIHTYMSIIALLTDDTPLAADTSIVELLADDATMDANDEVVNDAVVNDKVAGAIQHTEHQTMDDLIAQASAYVLEHDRGRFNALFECAEKWAIDTGAVFGGDVGKFLANSNDHAMTKDTYMWQLHVDNTWQNAKMLCDQLAQVKAPHVDMETLALETQIPNREMTIRVEARDLFKIFALDRYRGAKLIEIMKPPTTKGFFGGEVMIMPPLFNQIDALQTLYNPANFKLWPQFQLADIGNTKLGGAERVDRVQFAKYIRADPRVITVGDYTAQESGRLQLLADLDDDELKLLAYNGLGFQKAKRGDTAPDQINIISFATCLPDFQLRKRAVYYTVGDSQQHLCDVFNSPEYELVPFYHEGKYKYGHALVVARFALIEYWICQLIEATSGSNLEQRRKELMQLYENNITKVGTIPLESESYLGVNISAQTMKKKLIRTQKRMPPYYPTSDSSPAQ